MGVAEANIQKKDLVFIRTNPAGHSNCNEYTKPFSTVTEFMHSQQNMFLNSNLETVMVQNDYVDLVLEQRKRNNDKNDQNNNQQETTKNNDNNNLSIELFDISTLSALRPDGHDIDKECHDDSACVCMGYRDKSLFFWWNYLLFTNLQDIVEDKK